MAARILIIWSNYYQELAKTQLDSCTNLLKDKNYPYQIEELKAGTYEIPAVIQHFHNQQNFDGYLPLSLLLQGSTDHYQFIWQHISYCFSKFALQGIPIGNAIISAPTIEILRERVNNSERVHEAINALDYLINLKNSTPRPAA